MTVKTAAKKFNLSERRIQKLCETNRFEGCTTMSGVWLIPANAPKPSDERLSEPLYPENSLSLKDLCNELCISIATGRNWIKLGKLSPNYTKKGTPYFSQKYVSNLKSDLQSGKNTALKSRRNKKFVSGTALYNSYVSDQCKNIFQVQKLLELAAKEEIEFTTSTIQFLVADCALHLFAKKQQMHLATPNNLLLQFLRKEISVAEYDPLVLSLVEDVNEATFFCKSHPDLFKLRYIYEKNEDILGLIYISCKNIGNRKATGCYYTSTEIVNKIINKFAFETGERILDPCCGTGNFLLQLPETVTFDCIYGNDIDSISIKIAKLNMALKFNAPVDLIDEHITKQNYLTEYSGAKFHYIIGNPPWGYAFSDKEKMILKELFISTSARKIESYTLFIEHSLKHLEQNGYLAFILPEALLNVKAHTEIRKILLQSCSIKELDFLGNAFDGVQCPCIILNLQYTHAPLSTIGMNVTIKDKQFTIATTRDITPKGFNFTATDEEYQILKKVKEKENITFLRENADFALGIVTGNNKKYISNTKNDFNEVILRGSDISKYQITPANNYITFAPEHFQQTAPINMYRAPEKLLYRFISNQLVFAYDDKQRLSLNSCNIIIPKIPGLQIKYVMAVLNSRIAQFIYKKEFNSIKVLRSHIENIPIPLVDDLIQDEIIELTDKLITGLNLDEAKKVYDELDFLILQLFNLNSTEIETIKSYLDSENIF